jgi:hypothetical protein
MSRTRGILALTLVLLCGPRMDAQRAQQPANPKPGWPCVGRPDPSYVQIAEASGGQVFLFDPSELAESTVLIMAKDKHDETVFRGSGSLPDGTHEFSIPIDSTIDSALFSISLQCLQTVEITRPDGAPVQAADPKVEWHAFQAGRIVTVGAPSPGAWHVRVAGRGMFFLIVQARSTLSLDSAYFAREGGRTGHEGVFRAETPPHVGVAQLFEATLSGPVGAPRFALISSAAELLQSVTLRDAHDGGDERTYLGQVTPPATGFRLMASGVDDKGFPYQRVQAQLLQATAR